MIEVEEVAPARIFRLTAVSNKKKLFEYLAESLANASGESFEKVLDSLTARERMGSTCIGDGVAIPHCKLAIDKPIGTILFLDEAIQCGNKEEFISVIFGLIIPEQQCDQHLPMLSGIAEVCRTEGWLDGLRDNKSSEELAEYIGQSQLELSPYINEIDNT